MMPTIRFRRDRAPAAFVRAIQIGAPTDGKPEGRPITTITWDTGDGSRGVVALAKGSGRGAEIQGMVADSSGAVDVDWAVPGAWYRFLLYPIAEWEARESKTPRAIASATVAPASGERLEVAADLVVVAYAAVWLVGSVAIVAWLIGKAQRRLTSSRTLRSKS
ncbi:MAG: hypothetical protein ABIP53_01230 [Candidatus Limnocylindrales bacterium]